MSPVSTFQSSGSSSRLDARKKRPNRVKRSASGNSVPSGELAFVMVRNFSSVNKELPRFASVLVVDSIGTGRFQQALEQEGLADLVSYRCFSHNLGSAGNFAQRLTLASEASADFAYAVNHDGDVRAEAIER